MVHRLLLGLVLGMQGAAILSGCAKELAPRKEPPELASKTPLPELDPRAIALLTTYLNHGSAAMLEDRRPRSEILQDLKALPKPQVLALRAYVIEHPNLRDALELLGILLPEGHRDFLLKAMKSERRFEEAARGLANLRDPSLVATIFDQPSPRGARYLWRFDFLARTEFLAAVRVRHQTEPTPETAYVIGAFGRQTESEIRQCAASSNNELRWAALSGLSNSNDKQSLSLLLELADLRNEQEWPLVAIRFSHEGTVHVKELIGWLTATPEKERVAGYALARIPSDLGVSRALTHFQDRPFENAFAGRAANSRPLIAQAFVMDRLSNGTRQQKLNGLLVAHHLKGVDPPVRGKEHPLLRYLLKVSYDPDGDVRREAAQNISAYAYDANYPGGMKALRRLVAMLADPEPRVRSEAAIQASQYPSPEVLNLIKRMAANPKESAYTRDSLNRSAKSLAERLRQLPGKGQKPVHLGWGR